jgi:hypothetical protein
VIRFVSGASAAALLLGTAISPRAWADYAQDAHRVVEAAHLSLKASKRIRGWDLASGVSSGRPGA